MGQIDKLLASVLSGNQDKNIKFRDIQRVLLYLGFRERIRGDHYIYTRQGIAEKINIQPNGAFAKPYQVKQIRNIMLNYKLGADNHV
ncbi:MAG: type II toxin-antitoxin system HicA family toxin [Clostridiales bacterium]|nr:type II toxin-antitoxin system HicA family toxin [Clostridiales bacterium]